jgi:hypothetical protein
MVAYVALCTFKEISSLTAEEGSDAYLPNSFGV